MNTVPAPAAKPIDVLVVDDAVVVRRMIGEVLGTDPALRVIGTAADGKIALQKLQQLKPDLVTLDFEMPEMDGIETLRAIRKIHPKLPVIMFSTLTERGAVQTLDALAAGASDYVTKPANVGSVTIAQQRIREELIPKIKALCGGAHPRTATPVTRTPSVPRPFGTAAPTTAIPAPAPGIRKTPEALVIGISTGGPNALADMLPRLPRELPVPVLIVQHMPPMFTRMLAERLDSKCPLHVVEATAGMVVQPGTVYIAPGDYHMTVERRGTQVVTALSQGPMENSCRPAVDVLFRSAAAVYGERLLGAVLTGMGQDGLRGSEEIRRHHGHVLAQDQASSVVWGMPGFVANAGLADAVVPLSEMASEIVRRCGAAPLARGA